MSALGRSGSSSGLPADQENLRRAVTGAPDSTPAITWLDIESAKNRRVDKITWTSATYPGVTVTKQFAYSLTESGEYVPTTTGIWSVQESP